MDTLEKQTQKSPNSIIGKKTQDVGRFDPNAANVISDSKVNVTTQDWQAFKPMARWSNKS